MITRYFILSDLPSDSKYIEKFLSLKPDQIMKDVMRVLEMQPIMDKIGVLFVLKDAFRSDAMYDFETKRINIKQNKINKNVLQHEIAHAVVHQFLGKRLPLRWDEMIACAVDREL